MKYKPKFRYFYNGKFYRKFGGLARAYFRDNDIKAEKVRDGAGNVVLAYRGNK